MPADLVALDELSDRDLGAWRDLAARSLDPNPSFEPEFVLPIAQVSAPGEVALLRVAEGGEWSACLPVRRMRGWRRIPLPALVAWRHPNSLLGTPLVGSERPREAAAAIADAALEQRRTAFAVVELVGTEDRTAAAIADRLEERGARYRRALRFERAVIHRRPENDYLGVGVKHRREWQRQRRRLAEALAEDLEAFDRTQDPGAVRDFLALEAGGWKGREGTAFASIGQERVFTELCDGFRSLGRLQVLTFEAGGRRVAVKVNLLAGDQIYCFKIAFDDELARYSPGIQLELETVRIFHEDTTAEMIDSCAWPDNAMINRLWPDRRTLETIAFASAPIRGRIGVGAVGVGSWLRARR